MNTGDTWVALSCLPRLPRALRLKKIAVFRRYRRYWDLAWMNLCSLVEKIAIWSLSVAQICSSIPYIHNKSCHYSQNTVKSSWTDDFKQRIARTPNECKCTRKYVTLIWRHSYDYHGQRLQHSCKWLLPTRRLETTRMCKTKPFFRESEVGESK